jgi:hypothetical protein
MIAYGQANVNILIRQSKAKNLYLLAFDEARKSLTATTAKPGPHFFKPKRPAAPADIAQAAIKTIAKYNKLSAHPASTRIASSVGQVGSGWACESVRPRCALRGAA